MTPGITQAPLLALNISASYKNKPDVLCSLSLEVHPGEIVGLVGRSGEGKSTIALSILGLLGMKGGRCTGIALFQDRDLLRLSPREMRQVRGRQIGLIPQSPLAALNPNLRLGTHLEEAWKAHRRGIPDVKPLLEAAGLPGDSDFLKRYPMNLSVGMAQRFLIAMAVLHQPPLLLADEPTSALDTVTQAEILNLFRTLNREKGTAILYISHDLASVASLCHRVAILHQGQIVECDSTAVIFENPQHEYTKKLIQAIPQPPQSPLRALETQLSKRAFTDLGHDEKVDLAV